jgi:hypothetical protein
MWSFLTSLLRTQLLQVALVWGEGEGEGERGGILLRARSLMEPRPITYRGCCCCCCCCCCYCCSRPVAPGRGGQQGQGMLHALWPEASVLPLLHCTVAWTALPCMMYLLQPAWQGCCPAERLGHGPHLLVAGLLGALLAAALPEAHEVA